MKYVRLHHKTLMRDMVVLFSDFLVHAIMAEQTIKGHGWKARDCKVVSAGLFDICANRVRVYGNSTSLNIGPHDDDVHLIGLELTR